MRVAALDIAGPRHPPEGDDTAIRAGEVLHDGHGVAGCSVTTAFRLLEAPPLKDALRDSPASSTASSPASAPSAPDHRPSRGGPPMS